MTEKDVLPMPFTAEEIMKYRFEVAGWNAAGRPSGRGSFTESEGTMQRETARWLATLDAALAIRSEPCCIDSVAHAVREPSDGRALYLRCDEHGRREKLADDYYPAAEPSVPLNEPSMDDDYEAHAQWWIKSRFPEGFSGGGYTAFQIEQFWRNGFSAAWMALRTADDAPAEPVADREEK